MSRGFGIDRVFERRLAALINGGQPEILQGGRKGVEKESLRVTPTGVLAQTMHPQLLGSALTNEHITTDYSESLIELVTPAFTTSWELLQYLLDLHQFVYRHLGEVSCCGRPACPVRSSAMRTFRSRSSAARTSAR